MLLAFLLCKPTGDNIVTFRTVHARRYLLRGERNMLLQAQDYVTKNAANDVSFTVLCFRTCNHAIC
jgi:hypothetical protein